LGIDYKENYISTVWHKTLDRIVKAVELNYDEFLCKDYKKAWKKCNDCGRILLKDRRVFAKQSTSLDNLSGRCKRCEKKKRSKHRKTN